MKITIEEQTVTDFDWYGVDRNGLIVQFGSAGNILPSSVSVSHEKVVETAEYMLSLPQSDSPESLNPDLHLYKLLTTPLQKKNNLSAFRAMAKRGFFSFYCVETNDWCTDYYLVCYPEQPRHIESLLPKYRDFISNTIIPVDITSTRLLSIESLLNEDDLSAIGR